MCGLFIPALLVTDWDNPPGFSHVATLLAGSPGHSTPLFFSDGPVLPHMQLRPERNLVTSEPPYCCRRLADSALLNNGRGFLFHNNLFFSVLMLDVLQMWAAPKNFQGYWFFFNSLRISQLPSRSTTGTTLIALFNCLLGSPDEPGSCFYPIGGLLLIIALICSCFPRKLGAITLGKPHPAADPPLANAPAQHGQDDFPEDSCSSPPVQEGKKASLYRKSCRNWKKSRMHMDYLHDYLQ